MATGVKAAASCKHGEIMAEQRQARGGERNDERQHNNSNNHLTHRAFILDEHHKRNMRV